MLKEDKKNKATTDWNELRNLREQQAT
jgi:hypothetical protein